MSSVDIEAERRLIEQCVQGLCEADKSKDLDRIMEFFAEEIIYQMPGVPPLFGKDAVRNHLDGAFDNVEDMKAGSDRIEVSISGDLAYSVGWVKVKNYGMESYSDRKYFMVFKKTGDDWKIVAESFSRNF
jgi:ketosteroid isomerase-like protein